MALFFSFAIIQEQGIKISEQLMNKGPWTKDEHEAFLLGWKKYGNSWKDIATIVNMQTAIQVKKHAQSHVQKSLPPKYKARMLETHAVEQQQYRESLPPKKKARIMEADAVRHQQHRESLDKDKKIAARIKHYAATLHNMIDVDQATIEFLRDHFYKDPTLALAYYHCCSTNPCATIFNDELGVNTDTSAIWNHISKLIGDPIGLEETMLC